LGGGHYTLHTGTSLDKGDEPDALANLPIEKQRAVIDRAKAGETVSAKTEAKKQARRKRAAARVSTANFAYTHRGAGYIPQDVLTNNVNGSI